MDEVTIVVPAGSTLEVVGPARVRVMALAATTAAAEAAENDRPTDTAAPAIDAIKPETRLREVEPHPETPAEQPRRAVSAEEIKPVFGRSKAAPVSRSDEADPPALPVDVDEDEQHGTEQAGSKTPPADIPPEHVADDGENIVGEDNSSIDSHDGGNAPRPPSKAGRPLHRDLRDRSILHFERELAAIRGLSPRRDDGASDVMPEIVPAASTAKPSARGERDEPTRAAQPTDLPTRGSGFRVINGDGDEMWVYGIVDWCHAILDALSTSWDPRRVWFDNKGTFDALLMQASGSDAKQLAKVRADAERRIRIALKARR